jgi:hypothetical protein
MSTAGSGLMETLKYHQQISPVGSPSGAGDRGDLVNINGPDVGKLTLKTRQLEKVEARSIPRVVSLWSRSELEDTLGRIYQQTQCSHGCSTNTGAID